MRIADPHIHVNMKSLGALIMVMSVFMTPATATADCFEDAAAYQHVNPYILRAIAWQESHWHPDAVHLNANGSVDYGMMQINTIHLPELVRYNVHRDALMSPCKSVYVAAWQLRKEMNRYGNSWAAVGAYHSATPALRDDYALRIYAILKKWHVLSANGVPMGSAR